MIELRLFLASWFIGTMEMYSSSMECPVFDEITCVNVGYRTFRLIGTTISAISFPGCVSPNGIFELDVSRYSNMGINRGGKDSNFTNSGYVVDMLVVL